MVAPFSWRYGQPEQCIVNQRRFTEPETPVMGKQTDWAASQRASGCCRVPAASALSGFAGTPLLGAQSCVYRSWCPVNDSGTAIIPFQRTFCDHFTVNTRTARTDIVIRSAALNASSSYSPPQSRYYRDRCRWTAVPQALVITLVQADRRLVQHVHNANQARTNLARQTDTLCFTARKRFCRAGKRQVIQADVNEDFRTIAVSLDFSAIFLPADSRV